MNHSENPFCRPADPAVYGSRLDYLCTVTAADRVAAVRHMDAPTLRRALAVPDLQATVRRAIESRLRAFERAASPGMAESDTARITDAIARNTGTRWCGHCQTTQPLDGGRWLLTRAGKRRAWQCAGCVSRRKPGARA